VVVVVVAVEDFVVVVVVVVVDEWAIVVEICVVEAGDLEDEEVAKNI
jgi:hypothetical protein